MRVLIIVGCLVAVALGWWLYRHGSFDSFAQKPGEVFIRVGDYSEPHLPAQAYAGHYLPYALFAVWAYDRAVAGSPRLDGLLKLPAGGNIVRPITAELLDSWRADWVVREQVDGPLPCPEGEGNCGGRALGGLGYKVFSSASRNEIVVAFRGTDFHEADDWISNFRWVTRFLPYYDQYEQVQRHIGPILDRALAAHGQSNPRIVATGHSLGGGLAQQAAYKDGRIRAVYAFDPSTVTGYYDPGVRGKENSVGLLIDRVFQRGEILAYLRFFMTQLYPVSAFDPQTRTVRFSFGAHGNIVAKHSIDDLAAGLLGVAGSAGEWASRAKPLPNAPGENPGENWIYRLIAWVNRK
ncbi:MAG: DUF2974 domain-containing protein [Rhodopseudomonas sp.]|nr:DUF2974 domain-containing protein [Rhodopseudomonas sp.]